VDHEMVAGVRFELTTFGLCDLTQLSLRVGLYLHPAERDARHPVFTPPRLPTPIPIQAARTGMLTSLSNARLRAIQG
jgi:hypothetical protein